MLDNGGQLSLCPLITRIMSLYMNAQKKITLGPDDAVKRLVRWCTHLHIQSECSIQSYTEVGSVEGVKETNAP